jgi:hypothetical protein
MPHPTGWVVTSIAEKSGSLSAVPPRTRISRLRRLEQHRMGRATATLLLVGLGSLAGASTGNAQSEGVPPQVYVDILQQYWTELDEGTRPQSVCIAGTADSFVAADRPEAHELRRFLEERGFPVVKIAVLRPGGGLGKRNSRVTVSRSPCFRLSHTSEPGKVLPILNSPQQNVPS